MSASVAVIRSSQSGSTTLSASVVAYQVRAGSSSPHCDRAYAKPAARAAPTLPASTVTKWTSGPNCPASAVAAVVARVEHDDGQHRDGQAGRGGCRGAQTPRQVRGFVVRGDDHDGLMQI